MFLGVFLALIGVGCQAIGFATGFLVPSGSVQTLSDFIARMWIQGVIQAAGIALLGFGLFLFFFSVARDRPATRPWTFGGAIVVLVAGLVAAAFQVLYIQTWSALVAGTSITEIAPRLTTISIVEAAAGYTGLIATLVGLVGLARPSASA